MFRTLYIGRWSRSITPIPAPPPHNLLAAVRSPRQQSCHLMMHPRFCSGCRHREQPWRCPPMTAIIAEVGVGRPYVMLVMRRCLGEWRFVQMRKTRFCCWLFVIVVSVVFSSSFVLKLLVILDSVRTWAFLYVSWCLYFFLTFSF